MIDHCVDRDTHQERKRRLSTETATRSSTQAQQRAEQQHLRHGKEKQTRWADVSAKISNTKIQREMMKAVNDLRVGPPAPRGTHLWEFIRDILIHPERNQGLLKWEDRREGVFKFLKSEAVAQMWGQKKKNSSMTYEKLSRAMRWLDAPSTSFQCCRAISHAAFQIFRLQSLLVMSLKMIWFDWNISAPD